MNLNKKLISKDDVLRHTSDLSIFRYYIGEDITLDSKIKSPLRNNDERPSFGFFKGQSGEICFNDFVLGGGDCFKFLQLRYGLTFFEALSKVALDFGFADKYIIKQVTKTISNYDPDKLDDREQFLARANNFKLGKKARPWTASDYAFWLQFGVDSVTLRDYYVQPISYIFINGKPIRADKYAYAFTEHKDNSETYKIYQPFSKNYKWLNNHNSSVWQGWTQLPEKGHELIITKSLKDVMAITSLLSIPAVALQSESTTPKNHVVKQLKQRFRNIFILYDNDYDKEVNWGRKFGQELSELYFIKQIEIDSLYKSKDFSDLVKNHGEEEAKTILGSMIQMHSCPF